MRSVEVTFRPIERWPGALTPHDARRRWTFKAGYADTLDVLDRELFQLNAKQVVIQLAQDLRLDGMPRASARPEHPGVILAFDSPYGPLQYATDTFASWEHTMRAIALGLEALRKVDRYGITRRGEQYAGWKQLTAGDGAMTRQQAIDFASTYDAWDDGGLVWSALARATHPDRGGSEELFARAQEARRLLSA